MVKSENSSELINRQELTLRLAHKDLTGSDVLMVPAQVVKRQQKNRNGKKGMQIKLSKSNIRKQEGSGILSSLMPVLKSVAPTIGKNTRSFCFSRSCK